jgi:LysM repeat protein
VKEGETAWDVSQKYGIKLKWLYKRNRMQAGEKIEAGDKLWLRKKKPIELIEEEKSELPGIENGEVKASEP